MPMRPDTDLEKDLELLRQLRASMSERAEEGDKRSLVILEAVDTLIAERENAAGTGS